MSSRNMPFTIEHAMIVSKGTLESWYSKNPGVLTLDTSSTKNHVFDTAFDHQMSYRMQAEMDHKKRVVLRMIFEHDTIPLGANVAFHIESAGKTVKTTEPLYDKPRKSGKGKEERSVLLCSYAEVMNPENKYFVNDKMVIQMKALIQSKYRFKETFNLGSALWKRDDKDFVIVVGKEGEDKKTELKIHKVVLAAQSFIFDPIFATEDDGKLELVDFEVDVVQAAIEFFYDQEKLEQKNVETLIGLLKFAEKYSIDALKRKLDYALKFQIYPDTIVEIINASIMFNAPGLKEDCMEAMVVYMKSNTAVVNVESMDDDFATEAHRKTVMAMDL